MARRKRQGRSVLDDNEQMLDGDDVARKLRCSKATVAKMVRDGRFIPPVIETYNMKRWRERDVNLWIMARAALAAKIEATARKSLAPTKRTRR